MRDHVLDWGIMAASLRRLPYTDPGWLDGMELGRAGSRPGRRGAPEALGKAGVVWDDEVLW